VQPLKTSRCGVKSTIKKGKTPRFPARTGLEKVADSASPRPKTAVDNPVDNFGITYELSTGKG
jgi:hypothetical protein